MVATQATDQNPATPQEIWAILRETTAKQKEHELRWEQEAIRRQEEDARRKEEYARRQKEYEAQEARRQEEYARRQEEYARRQEEDAKRQAKSEQEWAELRRLFDRTDQQIARNNSEMGRLRNSFGEVIEHLVAPGIRERFGDLGMDFSSGKIAANMVVSEAGKDVAEADLWLENGQTILVVEVKAKVKTKDVGKHKERLEKIRSAHDKCGDRRRILGAMAGAVFGPGQREAALEAGFFVIVQSGDTMRMDLPEGFVPKEW